jgi:DNA-binding response OmpR family regulator
MTQADTHPHQRDRGRGGTGAKQVLILADDPLLRQDLVSCLAPFSRELRVVEVEDETSARQELDGGGVSLVVVDLAGSLMDGFAVASHVLKRLPEVPVVALTRELTAAAELDRQPGIWMLRKPVDLNRFRERVLTLLDRSPQGHLTDFSLVGLLQLLSFEGRSAVLDVESPEGRGRLVVSRGQLVHAEADGYQGEDAAYRVLTALARTGCNILLERIDPAVERTIHTSLTSILLEVAKRQDDLARGEERVPGD